MTKGQILHFATAASILFYCCFSFALEIDINNKRFKHITFSDGLTSSAVNSIIKDSKGFVWIGTNSGLNHFDGYNIKQFFHDENNSNSLSNSYITALHEDSSGNIWIGTMDGLNKFDIKSESFAHYFPAISEGNIKINNIKTLYAYQETLWIGMESGLYKLNIVSGEIIKFIDASMVNDFIFDGQYLWATSSKGLHRIEKDTQEVTDFASQNESIITYAITLHNGMIWLGTQYGVIRFNLQTKQFEADNRLLADFHVVDVAVDSAGKLWFSTVFNGLYRYSADENAFTKIRADRSDKFSLISDHFTNLYIADDIIWLGTQEGTSYTSLEHSVQLLRESKGQLITNTVSRITMDQEGMLWIGTSEGVTAYSPEKIEHYKDFGTVISILADDPYVWIGSNKGLFELNIHTGKIKHHSSSMPYFKTKEKHITDILQLKDDEFLLGTYYGIYRWHNSGEPSQLIEIEPKNSRYSNVIHYIHKKNDAVVVGTMHGLYHLSLNDNTIKRYLNTEEITILDKQAINAILEDENEQLWVASRNGVFKIKNRKIIERYTIENGLPDNNIHTLSLVDQVLWVSSNFGLAAFDISNQQFKKIHINNDDLNIEFNHGAAYKSADDILYFGSQEGLLYFDPKNFVKSAITPKTTITNFQLFNTSIKAGTNTLPMAITETDQIILKHDQNMLTFEFSSMNFTKLDHLYAFQIEGLGDTEGKWIYTDEKNRRATFTPNPGEYIFRVKSGWDENTWSDDIAELKITILPPWWQSNYAYTLYLLMLLLAIIGLIKSRTHRLQKQAEALRQEVADRTHEIQGLLQKKNELFANVSHELRTPLTLIMDPAKQLLNDINDPKHKDRLLLIKRSSLRLLHMVDQLLSIARTTEPATEQLQAHNFSKIIALLINSMQDLLKKRKLKVSLDCQEDIWVEANSEDLETIVMNLLTNAIKYSCEGDQITVTLKTHDHQAQLSVIDTGIGIAKEHHDTIFKRFKRIINEDNQNIPGTGIGLTLVKEVLDKYHGNIKMHSEINVGSTFIICLPLADPSNTNTQAKLSISSQNEASYLTDTLANDDSHIYQHSTEKQQHQQDIPRLLIIEDSKDMRDYIYTSLSEHYHCITADNGLNGLAQAKQHLPDLIVSDVMMPGMDGLELLRTLREDDLTSHIPIILLTAKTGKESELAGLNSLADDYISKPFDRDILLSRIKNTLMLRALLRDYFSQQFMQSEHPHYHFQKSLTDKKQPFLQKFHDLIEKNYHNHEFTLENMAASLHMSKRALQVKLKSLINQTPKEYLILYRLKVAAKLLEESTCPISDVQERSGFANASHFARSFKLYFSMSAREYRNRNCLIE